MKRQRPVCAFPPRRLAPSLEQWPGQWDGPDRQWEGPAPLCHNGRNGPQGRRPITATAATSGPEAAHSIRDHVRQGKRRKCKGITAYHHQPGCSVPMCPTAPTHATKSKSKDPGIQQNPVPEILDLKFLDPAWSC